MLKIELSLLSYLQNCFTSSIPMGILIIPFFIKKKLKTKENIEKGYDLKCRNKNGAGVKQTQKGNSWFGGITVTFFACKIF